MTDTKIVSNSVSFLGIFFRIFINGYCFGSALEKLRLFKKFIFIFFELNVLKLLLLIESDSIINDFQDSIDGLLITNLEINKLDKIKSKNLVGIKYPDKLLDVNKITNNNYDFVIIDDNKLSYKYLDNNSKTIYEINEDITDDDVDVISSFDFPVLFIEFKENLNFDEVESFFKLS